MQVANLSLEKQKQIVLNCAIISHNGFRSR